ncbi:MAG: hypothetical protein ACK4MZ_03355, partial [Thermomonas haemolytica]
ERSPVGRIIGLVLIVTGIGLFAGQGRAQGGQDGAWRGDLLFVLARVLARAAGHGEVLWQHERRR